MFTSQVVSQPITTMVGGFTQPATMMAAPVTMMAAPVTVAAPAVTEVDQVNAFGQVVERDFVVNQQRELGTPVRTGLNGVARVLGVQQAVVEVDRVNAFGQVVERDLIGGSGVTQVIGGGAVPTIRSAAVVGGGARIVSGGIAAAPMVSYGAPALVSQPLTSLR